MSIERAIVIGILVCIFLFVFVIMVHVLQASGAI